MTTSRKPAARNASQPAAYRKSIQYDRQSKDFAMYLDGELVAYARTYLEAEIALDQLVYELLSSGFMPQAEAPESALIGNEALCEAVDAGAVPTEAETEQDAAEVAAVRADVASVVP